ncbi:MAG TPA: GGDEF domain-containing protein [Acidimicrobiales bacterium]|nr:GGDEF domain-containing protein [Acidimicrobiales bacterium]
MCLAGGLWLGGYAVATALVAGSERGQLLLGDVAFHVPLLLAAVAALTAGARLDGRSRTFWRVIGLSVALIAVGEGIWSFYELVLRGEPPTPSWADPFYLLGSFAVIPAVFIRFGAAPSDRRNRAWLDAAIVTAGAGAIGWHVLIGPQLTGGLTVGVASQVAYPLLDIAVLVVLVSVGFGGHRKVPPTMTLVGIAYAIAALGDAMFSYMTLHGFFASGGWIDITWEAQFVLLGIAAVAAIRHPATDAQVVTLDRDLGQIPVVLGAALVAALAFIEVGRGHPLMSVVIAAVVAGLLRRHQLTARDLRQVGNALEQLAAEQTRLATTDELTSLYNRRFVVDAARGALGDRRAGYGYVAMLELDIDHFKQVNDTHGHDAGDVVLAEVARRVAACGRASDIVARYGGEEFVILLRVGDPGDLWELAERWRSAVSAGPVVLPDGASVQPTVSVGGACAAPGLATLDQLFVAADRALYAAKGAGRNRVVLSAQPCAA